MNKKIEKKKNVSKTNTPSKKNVSSSKKKVVSKKENIKELLLEKKILWLSILIIFLLLLIVVGLLIYHQKRVEKGYPIQNIINNSEALTSEHCLDDVCLEGMTLAYYKDGVSFISANMIYHGEYPKDVCLKIQFQSEGETATQDFNTCYYDVIPGEETPIETYFTEEQKELVYSKDYVLTYLSEDEENEIYQAREEELILLEK